MSAMHCNAPLGDTDAWVSGACRMPYPFSRCISGTFIAERNELFRRHRHAIGDLLANTLVLPGPVVKFISSGWQESPFLHYLDQTAAPKLAQHCLALPSSASFWWSPQQTIQFAGGVKAPGLVVTTDRMPIDKDLRYGSPGGQTLHFGSPCWVIGDVDFFKLHVL